jgi:hypothetical protein
VLSSKWNVIAECTHSGWVLITPISECVVGAVSDCDAQGLHASRLD